MTDQPKKDYLRLVVSDQQREAQRRIEAWLLEDAPDPIPDDVTLIAKLAGCPSSSATVLRETVETLIADAKLDRVQIGARSHLTRAGATIPYLDLDRERFRLEVANDIEAERHVLYKTGIALELITILILMRQLTLVWLGAT